MTDTEKALLRLHHKREYQLYDGKDWHDLSDGLKEAIANTVSYQTLCLKYYASEFMKALIESFKVRQK